MTENGKEKKFVIKYVFENISHRITNNVVYGNDEKHFGMFWKLSFRWKCLLTVFGDIIFVHLEFRKPEDVVEGSEWSMEIEVESNLYKESMIKNRKHSISEKSEKVIDLVQIHHNNLKQYLVNGNLEAEFQVKIKRMTGFKFPKLRNFDDDVAKKFSDICLMAGNQNFYVNKMFMASHSTYFESLFLGNFEESQKSIIELKDIDAEDLQKFLEVLYGERYIDDETFTQILSLSDYFDAKTAVKRCEEFLMTSSRKSLEEKFGMAVKYKMENLKKKCLSEIQNSEDIRKILPEVSDDHENCIYKELLEKSMSFK